MTVPMSIPVMGHLFNTRVCIYRLEITADNGRPFTNYVKQKPPLDRVACRLDLTFVRPGKDQPQPVEAGKAPDRIGVMFCDSSVDLRSGDLLMTVANDQGVLPLKGTFEIRVVPDQAQDFFGAHHTEVQIVESSQQLHGVFPGSE